MKIREITEYVMQYVHPDVEKQLKKYEKRATGRARMGYAPGYMSYPYRVREGKKWSKKYKKSINCANPKGFSQKAHCACLLYTSPSPRDLSTSRMPSSA